jgi:gliding motility-associated-like protein
VRVIQDPRLDLPNIFSPNGDNVNDLIIYPPFPSVEKVLDFKIFDNWGSLIFEAGDFDPSQKQIEWDGTFNGKRLNPGVFVYLNKVLLKNGEIILTSGDITLIR